MFAICNVYAGQGAGALYDRLFESSAEIDDLMRDIPGFVSYTMVRTKEGGYSIVVVENQSDLPEVGKIVGAYIQGLAAELGPIDPPESHMGPVGLHI